MKLIRLSAHALGYVDKRGFTEDEVKTAIQNGVWHDASHGRFECRYNFSFEKMWNGKFYPTKQVRPIFVEEDEEIIVVTVYTYFF